MIEVTSHVIDPDCGCIEQELETDVGFVSLHFRPDGLAELYFDNGDADWEERMEANSIDDLHVKIQRYINELPLLG